MSASRSLAGKTAIVTGASSGIGRAIAETLGAAGAHVFLAGRSAEPMEAAKKKIETGAGRGTVVVLNVREPAQVEALVERAVRETGRLDVMVNNAGLSYPAKITDGEPEEWRAMLETNVLGLLAGCRAAVRAMRKGGSPGHVVNISSIAAQRPDSGVYGATKHAVNCISSSLRAELENDPIRVVNVMPGAIATNFGRNFDPKVIAGIVGASGLKIDVAQGEKLPDEVFEKAQPLLKQLLGSAEDVADAVLYAVTLPPHVNVADIVVRPPKQLALA
ncbi:MAG TPA: SDR family oxidoreductase [Myxococcota bacterium]|nr:SDR family oxidoreductase [Myxococcota bacterium]